MDADFIVLFLVLHTAAKIAQRFKKKKKKPCLFLSAVVRVVTKLSLPWLHPERPKVKVLLGKPTPSTLVEPTLEVSKYLVSVVRK